MSISVACSAVVSFLEVMVFVCVRVLWLKGLVFWDVFVALVVFVVLLRISMLLLSSLLYEKLSLCWLSLLRPSFFSNLRVLWSILLFLLCDIFGLLFLLFIVRWFLSLILSFLLITVINSFILRFLNNIGFIILAISLMHFMYIFNML